MRKKGLEETLKLTRGRVGGCLGRVLEKCGNSVCGGKMRALYCLFVPARDLAVFARGWSQASFDVDRCLKKRERRDVCVDVTLKLHGINNGNLSSQILLRRLSVCMTTHTHSFILRASLQSQN